MFLDDAKIKELKSIKTTKYKFFTVGSRRYPSNKLKKFIETFKKSEFKMHVDSDSGHLVINWQNGSARIYPI